MNGIFLIIGGNLGNREAALQQGKELLQSASTRILRTSLVYETASWGQTQNPPYLNQVLEIETTLAPEALMEFCLATEQRLGRLRKDKWESRIIDIDILFYHHIVLQTPTLQIPHPHIAARRFVLTPLVELIPEEIHPSYLVTIEELYARCNDPLEVVKFTTMLSPEK